MDISHFGDSYDIVKQSFLRWLSPCGMWTADSMFTSPVSTAKAKEFSSFLGVALVTKQVFTQDSRSTYFSKPESTEGIRHGWSDQG